MMSSTTLRTVSNLALCCRSRMTPLPRRRCSVAGCPHILHVLTASPVCTSCMHMMTLTPTALVTYALALGKDESDCVDKPASLFFMLGTRGSQGTA
jgi:hypothetical protein